jgi:hypothetical protein
MNKLYTITSLFIIILSISAFKNSDSSIEIIRKNDQKRFENFKTSVHEFNEKVFKFEQKTLSFDALKASYFDLRKSYKSWEYLAEHYDAVFIKENIKLIREL